MVQGLMKPVPSQLSLLISTDCTFAVSRCPPNLISWGWDTTSASGVFKNVCPDLTHVQFSLAYVMKRESDLNSLPPAFTPNDRPEKKKGSRWNALVVQGGKYLWRFSLSSLLPSNNNQGSKVRAKNKPRWYYKAVAYVIYVEVCVKRMAISLVRS